jgi:GT2 family glycosyltransferase
VSDTPFFSVLIINYNGGTYLQKAIDSLSAQTFQNFETIIIDNDSTDGSMNGLDASALPHCDIDLLGRNSGFAEGNNIAAKKARGEWLALLNADAEAAPDWLETLASSISAHPDCRMFASTQLSMDDNDILDGIGDGYTIWGFAWRGGYHRPASEIPEAGETFAPCGASAVYHRETFLAHGGFEERYFCFMEDVDLGFRMRLAGEYCLFQPDAIVQHKGGGLSGEASEFSVYHGARNRVWTYIGNMPAVLLWLTLPGHLALTAYLLIRYIGTPYSGYVWKGTKDGWLEAFKFRRERKALRSDKRSVTLSGLSRMFHWNIFAMSQHRSAVRPSNRR